MSSFGSGRGHGGYHSRDGYQNGGRGGRGGRNNNNSSSSGGNNSSSYNNNNNSNNPSHAQPKLQLCRNFASGQNCHHGDKCNFSHVVKMHASVDASDKNPDAKPNYNNHNSRGYNSGGGNNKNKNKDRHKVTSVAVWETNGAIKLFTGSHDGKWRLWNTSPTTTNNNGTLTLTKEFEHFAGGPVDTIHIASPYFFCGFEAPPTACPDAKAGNVHIWNLNAASDPPMELWMNSMSKYASSGRIRSLWTTADGRVWSGGTDGVIRQWAFNPTSAAGGQAAAGQPGFSLVRSMSGHLGAVTGLALVGTMLWSGGMDGTVRLWNAESGEQAHLIPAVKKDANDAKHHSGPVTGLLPFEAPNNLGSFVFSSSLDDSVKVWNATNGECVASESHGQGVTSIALTSDQKGNPLLLCGLFYGDIMIRGTISNPPLVLLLKLSHQYIGVGHELGPVNDIQVGQGNTFYAVADDGKLTVWQITGDFGL